MIKELIETVRLTHTLFPIASFARFVSVCSAQLSGVGADCRACAVLPLLSPLPLPLFVPCVQRIRPAVQEDGGDIDFRSFDEQTGLVRVQMQGACKGCASSAITLKNGIENMLMHYVPEVKAVEEEKDEVRESVSEEQLKKLEEKLAQAKPIPTASAV
jgi:Fe-S cluster biogenesis protein NfuA